MVTLASIIASLEESTWFMPSTRKMLTSVGLVNIHIEDFSNSW